MGGAGLAAGLGQALSRLGQNMDENQAKQQEQSLQRQQLELEKQAQAYNIKSDQIQNHLAQQKYQQEQLQQQNFQLGRQNFVKQIMTDPAMASLKPLAPLIGAMDPSQVGGFIKDYSTQMQKKNDQMATQKAYEDMALREPDPRKAQAWKAAAMMAGSGSAATQIAPVLKSAGITADDGQEALRKAQAELAEANAGFLKMEAAYLNALPHPGMAGGGTPSGMPPGLPPLPSGIPSGGTFGGTP